MRATKDGYYTNRHSCFLLQYHLVLVTKFRKPVIDGELKEGLLEYVRNYFKQQNLVLLEVDAQPDQLHIQFEAPPQIVLANFVNAFKAASSRIMRSRYQEQVSQHYSDSHFWSLSYFIGSVSDRTADTVKRYIQNQDEQE